MPISINCPSCSKKYTVPSRLLGKKVTCSTDGCGATFLAIEPPEAPPEPEPEEHVEEFDFEEIADSPSFPPLKTRSMAAADTSDEKPVVAEPPPSASNWCGFAMCGRLMVLSGFSLLAVGSMMSHVILHNFDYIFNTPLAMQKLSTILIGLALLIGGATYWSGSKRSPSGVDSALIIVGLVVVMAAALIPIAKSI